MNPRDSRPVIHLDSPGVRRLKKVDSIVYIS